MRSGGEEGGGADALGGERREDRPQRSRQGLSVLSRLNLLVVDVFVMRGLCAFEFDCRRVMISALSLGFGVGVRGEGGVHAKVMVERKKWLAKVIDHTD